ncbi:hypothetical protein CFC21_085459 [Triticum aestivum]|uniref:Remorin C-terminal domain-containing protein n=2 Tax=Triticum aestivum TaxID=4565 RepID=A0A3B6NVH8_WHEAT|nr:remorin 1.4-like [Triticum aestivum]KAF7081526.1 hypothetical protein CFC21_085459 [Triticum aestivum]
METQQEPTKAGAVVASPGVAGGGGLVLENEPPAPTTAQQGPPGSATDRDAVLAKVEMNRKLSMVKAWEENQKSKADNRAEHKMSSILSWENTKKAAVQAKLRTREEKLERKKAEYAEKMRNRAAMIHKEAEEQRAAVEARRQEEMIKCQETAAKHRSQGTTPAKKFLTCFG